MHRFVCVFRALLSSVHTHLSCEKSSFELELDHTGLGLKSTQKGQGAAYLLCRAFERWMVCVCYQDPDHFIWAALPFPLSLTFENAEIQGYPGSLKVLEMDGCF